MSYPLFSFKLNNAHVLLSHKIILDSFGIDEKFVFIDSCNDLYVQIIYSEIKDKATIQNDLTS